MRVPKRSPFWDQFWNQFWHQFQLKIIVFGKVPRAIWHYYNNGFRVVKGFALEPRTEPLRNPVWARFWSPFWSPNPNKICKRAAKRDFGAAREDTGSEKKGIQKWTQKWIDEKSVGCRKRASRRPQPGRFQVHGEGYREG